MRMMMISSLDKKECSEEVFKWVWGGRDDLEKNKNDGLGSFLYKVFGYYILYVKDNLLAILRCGANQILIILLGTDIITGST